MMAMAGAIAAMPGCSDGIVSGVPTGVIYLSDRSH